MRDYNNPEYKKFRTDVKSRDNRQCRWPNCNCRKKLQVHHILPWSKYPYLRFNPINGITLCKKHHKDIRGKELFYVKLFLDIIKQ